MTRDASLGPDAVSQLDDALRANIAQLAAAWTAGSADAGAADELRRLFDAQVTSRHLDVVARELQAAGRGYYTIGSAGHESNAAVALAARPNDPALAALPFRRVLCRARGPGRRESIRFETCCRA